MSPQDFKQLNNKFIEALKEKFQDSEVLVFNTNNPFERDAINIGISLFKGSNVCEMYSLTNNGEEASWRYLGNTQFK